MVQTLRILLPLLISGATQALTDGCSGDKCPEQRHLSFGQTPEEMVVMWVTPENVEAPVCEYGTSDMLGSTTKASSTRIWQINGIHEYSHTCEIAGLSPGERYFYKVGDQASGVFSSPAAFRAKPASDSWSPTILVYGDMGQENDISLPDLIKEAESGENDFVLHAGDFAYDFMDNGGQSGRNFMRDIDPIASRLPYMTTGGNHEGGTDFDHISALYHYMHRFQMPGKGDLVHGSKGNNVYYSFDAGPVHFISFSSEVYFWQLWDTVQQFEWLRRDLASVNRTRTPWVVTMSHRPMYCSTMDGDDCNKIDSNLRTGLPVLGKREFALEELFNEHQVDLSLWAHEHMYERTWPVFNNQVKNGTEAPYTNPGATVHIVSGNAGNREHLDTFRNETMAWSAVRSSTYGYGKLRAVNGTHLQWRQLEAVSGKLVDEIMLIKTTHDAPRSYTIAAMPEEPQKDIQVEQRKREEIYKWSQGCTKRNVFPQNACTAAKQDAVVI